MLEQFVAGKTPLKSIRLQLWSSQIGLQACQSNSLQKSFYVDIVCFGENIHICTAPQFHIKLFKFLRRHTRIAQFGLVLIQTIWMANQIDGAYVRQLWCCASSIGKILTPLLLKYLNMNMKVLWRRKVQFLTTNHKLLWIWLYLQGGQYCDYIRNYPM